ncbi:MAG: molybdopterin molybdotransferase MoeA [Terrisporobacter othiniensis]|uniref:molybdopterin molybdotransferase MoeA n=1 Tax=Terrisporobacter petrolearius TaxID=1460447 RepID=UPI0022E8E092|nr:gephyrin-like molybdotransferase Glp [Terrisporobacter petrolearius]MDU4861248.1 molybdopterin molybdotransferase MoeA [Terrisporobacter othiniensis]MDU6994882.1 molybdopterin molybdotransferase MoeA [Terrisporobacter othiniensis]
MENIELEFALQVIEESVNQINNTELIKIEECRERIIGEDIYAPINQPPFNRSPLDGYALRAEDTVGACKSNPIKLKVVDEVFAGGNISTSVKNNEAIRIMTGAEIPEGADCVIRQENTNYSMEDVEIYSELKKYENYCFAGEDVKKGSKLISKGEKLTYIHIGLLATMGITQVLVKRKPRIGIISTGDEIVSSGKPLSKGKIYDSNRITISMRLMDFGCEIVSSKIIEDEVCQVSKEINNLIDKVDVIITTGGVSVGKKDIMHEVINKINADRLFWRVRMKPGTPAIYSIYKKTPILSLSGNPFAAIATFEIMGKELIYKLSGDEDLKQIRIKSVMKDNFLKESKGRRIVRGIYKNNKVYLPQGGHSPGMMASMLGCNCLIDIKPGTKQLLKGDEVDIILI